MIYSINGFARRSTTTDPAMGLQVDCSLNARGSSFNNTILVLPDSIITGSRASDNEPIRDAISITLQSGWNLIGIPLNLDNDDPAQFGSTVNTIDAPATSLEAGQAYWVFNPGDIHTAILSGTQSTQAPVPFGISLYTPVRVSPVPSGATAFFHSASGWRELPAEAELQPSEGYLLHR